MKRTINKTCMGILIVLMLCVYQYINPMEVYAKEATDIIGTLITADEEVRLLEEPSADVEAVVIFEPGNPIMVTGEEDSYYVVGFQGEEYYVMKTPSLENSVKQAVLEATNADGKPEAVTEEKLNEQFQEENRISSILAEEVARNQTERRRSIIWGSVIAVLIVAVFAVGFFRTRNKEQEDEIGM